MTVSYQLRAQPYDPLAAADLYKYLLMLQNSGEIEIHTTRDVLACQKTTLFSFCNWKRLAEKKYLETKEFKSAIPTYSKELRDSENSVRMQLFEAAESELLASRLNVSIEMEDEQIVFRTEYPDFMTERQAEQVGLYLQQKLESIFHDRCANLHVRAIEFNLH